MYTTGSTSDRLPFWTGAHRDGLFNERHPWSGFISLYGTTPLTLGSFDFEAGAQVFLRQGKDTKASFNQFYVSAGYGSLLIYAGFTSNPQLHEKSMFIRLGGDLPVRAYGGLIHYVLFGGTTPGLGRNPGGFPDFWKVFFFGAGGDDSVIYEQEFALGDHVGAWDFGLDFDISGNRLWLYKQFVIETKKNLLFNAAQDGLYGLAYFRENPDHWWSSLLWEFVYTKNQNGPWWAEDPDRPPGKSGQMNYYNHYLYRTGWTYHGRTIGSPLLYPRLEGGIKDQNRIANNRILAHHLGIEGRPHPGLYYKAMFTYSRNYGTYRERDLAEERGEEYFFTGGPEQVSVLFEAEYRLPGRHNLVLLTSLGLDLGSVFPDRGGMLVGLRWVPR
ncbi:MAG: capsule assembly Wzi family protein [Rhodothermaceae bacterium]|nr:capsule assembly Wzi family protein [Rhodothermaceae bacterium]